MIRYNTDTNVFEAYDGQWTELGGVYDDDRDIYITPELTLRADDDTIRFYAGGSTVADVTADRFDIKKLEVDDISVSVKHCRQLLPNRKPSFTGKWWRICVPENFSFNEPR